MIEYSYYVVTCLVHEGRGDGILTSKEFCSPIDAADLAMHLSSKDTISDVALELKTSTGRTILRRVYKKDWDYKGSEEPYEL